MKAVIYLSVFLWGLEHMVSASNKNFRAIWSFYYFFCVTCSDYVHCIRNNLAAIRNGSCAYYNLRFEYCQLF